MTISELIQKLSNIKEGYGNIDVFIHQALDAGLYIETKEVIIQLSADHKYWVGIK